MTVVRVVCGDGTSEDFSSVVIAKAYGDDEYPNDYEMWFISDETLEAELADRTDKLHAWQKAKGIISTHEPLSDSGY